MLSTFGMPGSVNRRNFVPVRVWKHWSRNKVVSSTSMPEGGSGRSSDVGVEESEESVESVLEWDVEGREEAPVDAR
ncbi:hypothetical protein BPAE_0321g00110 [Botrytis paeoniae]|uniref:Uncharacterized protein n=1 Tax=Botrytis paeoniae TaxID=278948 RepID=A0A4Z1F9G6_9HELO|nr:hypothetical protein BPAE_0321g00110 [Botrytis paeoniae]